MEILISLLFSSIFLTVQGTILDCKFSTDADYGYKCHSSTKLSSPYDCDRIITGVTGTHEAGKDHKDVTYFVAAYSIEYMPKNLTSFFPNIDTIYIGVNDLTKDDLKQFGPKLKNFWTAGSKMQVIDENLFQYTPNIVWAYFDKDKIRHVDRGAFAKIRNLRKLTFGGHPCYSTSATYDTPSNVNWLIGKAEQCQDAASKVMSQIAWDAINKVNQRSTCEPAPNEACKEEFSTFYARKFDEYTRTCGLPKGGCQQNPKKICNQKNLNMIA